ncbi:hypothetical protein M8J75_000911 [Diaphorina citri]|nr:hypothetical protein M8J75_000911 [Diaphorina citri]
MSTLHYTPCRRRSASMTLSCLYCTSTRRQCNRSVVTCTAHPPAEQLDEQSPDQSAGSSQVIQGRGPPCRLRTTPATCRRYIARRVAGAVRRAMQTRHVYAFGSRVKNDNVHIYFAYTAIVPHMLSPTKFVKDIACDTASTRYRPSTASNDTACNATSTCRRWSTTLNDL